MISAAKKLARLLLASAAAAGFVAPAVSAPLSADPNVRQLSNRKNYEPGGKYFLFGNARGGVQKRNGKINIRTSPPVAAGNMETETVYFGGRYGYETKFGGHPWQAHGPFDETAARNGKGKGAGVADGFGATNYVYSISATKVHPANGYDGPQGGNFPPPKGARDIYSYSVSGSASRSRMVEPQKAPCIAGVSCPASPFFNHIPLGTETHSDRHIREGAQEQSPTAHKNIEDAVRLARAEALRTEEIAKGITRVRDFEQEFHTDKPYGFTADQLAAFGRGEASPLGWLVANGTGVGYGRIRPEYITPEYIGPTDGNTVPDWIRQPLKQDADVLAKTANALTRQSKAQLTEWDGGRSFPANAAQKVAGAASIIKTARDGLAETTVGKKIGAATDAVTPDALKNGIGKLVDAGNRRMTEWAGNDPDRKAYAAAAGGVIGIVADSRLPGKGRGKNRHKHSGDEPPNHGSQTHDRADLDDGRNPSKARDTNHSGASGSRHHAGGQPESLHRPDSSRNPDRPRQESPRLERPTRDRPNSLPNRPDAPKPADKPNNAKPEKPNSGARDGDSFDTGVPNVKAAPLSAVKGTPLDIDALREKLIPHVKSGVGVNNISIAVARVTVNGKTEHYLSVSGSSWKGNAPDIVDINGTKYNVVRTDTGSLGTVSNKEKSGNYNHAEMKLGDYINQKYSGTNAQVDVSVQNTSNRNAGVCNLCQGKDGGTPFSNLGRMNPNMNITVYHGTTGVNP